MKITTYIACLVLSLGGIILPCCAKKLKTGNGREYSNPERFEQDIQNFERADKEHFPSLGAIVCIGSSSIVGWHSAIVEDLAPLTIIPRGFGGSTMNDALHYIDRIVIPYKPRAIVIYEGDNDIAEGIAPEKILDTFRKFIQKVYRQLPEARIYFLSIKPSISRWKLWPQMEKTNRLIEKECSRDKQLIYVDVASPMLDNNNEPRKEIFQKDNLHMTREGYVIWREVIKPILTKRELQFEH
jgi:lysophospholipase L1-like esterase